MNPFPAAGLLGMNRRNGCVTLVRNPRELYPLVDDKLKTKELLEQKGLPTPELYFKITHNFELKLLREIKYLGEFVIKPARGAEGRGIMVITNHTGDRWEKASGEVVSGGDIEYHVSNILAGLYSLGGTNDRAFLEYRVQNHPIFSAVSFRGVPDIRVVLYRGVPIMSMLRLPTRESDGRANLHQGAVGVGIRMADGVTLGGVHHNRLMEKHPDTKIPVAGIRIPFWTLLLETAVKLFDVFQLGYVGVDFVIDSLLGPLILEINARPGLNIQLANRAGLLARMQAVDRFGGVEALGWERRLELFREAAEPAAGNFG